MSKVYIPSKGAEDWKPFLAEPEKQWRRGYSARTLAHCWHDSDGIPNHVEKVLCQATELTGLEALIVIPEHQVPLPGGARPSQNDIWVLGRTENDLVSIAVEGKVSEPFGPTIGEWGRNSSDGKNKRYNFLCSMLGLHSELPEDIRYQLLHRTASAIIEAKRFHANHAVMLVHSFGSNDEWFEDYKCFMSLFGASAALNRIVSVGKRSGVWLHFAWVRGEKQYLNA